MRSIAQTYSCDFKTLDYAQEQGLISSLPLGMDQVSVNRSLTTSSAAIFIPFTVQELFMRSGRSMYYGLNPTTNNVIMADRTQLMNANGVILGTPGSGKSFAAKREISNVFLSTDDDIIITDPESEYSKLVQRFGGQVIELSSTSASHINPMDMQPDIIDGEDPVKLKSEFILSLFALIAGRQGELLPKEKSIIDRCVSQVYEGYLADPRPENMPILGDLYSLILKLGESDPTARDIATALELYVTGSLNVFNHQTNVDITNRLVCYDIKKLGNNLKALGMLIMQDQVWQRVAANRDEKKTTWLYQDEVHLLLRDKLTAAYCVEMWKRFRKWGGIPTAITQNVKLNPSPWSSLPQPAQTLAVSRITRFFTGSKTQLTVNLCITPMAPFGSQAKQQHKRKRIR